MIKGKEEEGENKPCVTGQQRFLHGNDFWSWNDNEVRENGFSLETSIKRWESTRLERVI
jgi:hypothetical protein